MLFTMGDVPTLAKRALNARLFDPDGGLKILLAWVAKYPSAALALMLLEDASRPWGVCLIDSDGLCSVYVEPSQRYKGYGRELVARTRALVAQPVFSSPGADFVRSLRFWQHCDIPCRSLSAVYPLMSDELATFVEKGLVLCERDAEEVPLEVYEDLYLEQLYESASSDEADGIKGRLACIFNEGHKPFNRVYYHLTPGDGHVVSLALVIEGADFAGVPQWIVQIYVKPSFRRQGLGQEILTAVKKRLPSDTSLSGYHLPIAQKLFERNAVGNLLTPPTSRVK